MLFLRSSKSLTSLAGAFILTMTLGGCMDKAPKALRQAEEYGRSQYFGYKASRHEEIEASYLAAQSTCCGPDTIKDDVKALNYYCKAAKWGHKASMIEIGRMYMHENIGSRGTAIPFDRPLAYAYLQNASLDGYEFAEVYKDGLTAKMNLAEIERGKQLAEQFPNIPCEIVK